MSDEDRETYSIALLMVHQLRSGEIRQERPSAPHPYIHRLACVGMCELNWVGLGGSYPRM